MISIREVAKLAGVSPSTVSRVINGTANVEREKRLRVERVIEETGFKPNEVARSLFKKSAHMIGVIVPNIENPFFNEMAKTIEDEAYKNGYSLTLCSSNDNVEKEKNNIDLLRRMNVDGMILLTNEEAIFSSIKASNVPMVVLDRKTVHSNEVAYLQADNYTGGRMTMEHLLECGCRHIVKMRGPQEVSSGRERFNGYLDVCREHGLMPAYVDCGYNYEDGLKSCVDILEKFPDVDGIIAANDMVALGVYKILRQHGKRVPEDVQLIGFDNILMSQVMTPELTTIEQPIEMMGRRAMELLLDHISGKEVVKENIFSVRLIKRETTTCSDNREK